MHAIKTLLLISFPLAGLAARDGFSARRNRHYHHRPRNEPQEQECFSEPGRKFNLIDLYQGKTFFDGWDFFTGPDPTHGNVNYLKAEDAFARGLAFVQDDNTTVLAVDDHSFVPVGGNRDSVRLGSKKSYNEGLFIADFFAMPHGCSVWPAWWTVGPNWPQNGEIDVVEGVNNQATNQMTLHTSEGCTIERQVSPDPNLQINAVATGKILTSQCAFINGDNSGCAFTDTDTRSHGRGFNMIAGGVFAHLWEKESIKIWHFPRGEIPADIDEKNPDPSTWPAPAAHFTSATCDIENKFNDHVLVLDTTICGDLAGPTYAGSGCPGTCAEAVANPKNFLWAKWKINYIAVYN